MPKNREVSTGGSVFHVQIRIAPPFRSGSTKTTLTISSCRRALESRSCASQRRSRARTSLTYIEGKFRENLTRKIRYFVGEWSLRGGGTRTSLTPKRRDRFMANRREATELNQRPQIHYRLHDAHICLHTMKRKQCQLCGIIFVMANFM